jgi:hypothetical protein
MKNRKDETKCYSALLEFSEEKALAHFAETYPARGEEEIMAMVKKEDQVEEAYSDYL